MKIRKELWFGLVFMSLVVMGALYMLLSVEKITNGHLGLLMLSLVVTAIMLGFPTAFTLMGMGMLFSWMAYDQSIIKTLDLMVQSAYKTMASDVLIAIPLFVFMGYLVERANLIEKLFKSLHLAMARIPGSLAVATLVTCAIFATATGIVGAVVTLMGLLALPAMLRAGYSVPLAAGAMESRKARRGGRLQGSPTPTWWPGFAKAKTRSSTECPLSTSSRLGTRRTLWIEITIWTTSEAPLRFAQHHGGLRQTGFP